MRFLKKSLPLLLALVLMVSALPFSAVANGGICGDDIGWFFDGSTLTLSGSGPMYDYKSDAFGRTNTPWAGFTDDIETVILAGSITHIGDWAFNGCSNMKHINFPQSITSIGHHAFYYCRKLTSITLPNKLTSIDYDTFRDCDSLVEITIPKGITTIPSDCFYSCDNLSKVVLPEGLTTIENAAFQYCYKLRDVNLPSTLTYIGKEAFDCCLMPDVVVIPAGITTIEKSAFGGSYNSMYGMKELILPEGLTSIKEEGFNYRKGLKTVTIPDSVESIGKKAFYVCDALTSVTIGSGVTSIGEEAFYICEELTTVTIGSGVTSIGAKAFRSCNKLTDVYYIGSEDMWNRIDIGEENDPLLNATIHFSTPEHTHAYSETVTPPTCTEQGYTTYTCTCGDSYVDSYVPATGHSGGEATCQSAAICSACGTTYGEKAPENHVGGTRIEGKVDATETEEGYTGDTYCIGCGGMLAEGEVLPKLESTEPEHEYQYGDANHDGKINVTDAVMVMKHRANALTEEDVFCERCAHVDTNPKINVSDAVLIMKKRANKDMIFPIEAQ